MASASKKAEEFGKDLGLMHQLALSGRAVGMEREDWAALAHDRDRLRMVLYIARKYGVLNNHVIETQNAPWHDSRIQHVPYHNDCGYIVWEMSQFEIKTWHKDLKWSAFRLNHDRGGHPLPQGEWEMSQNLMPANVAFFLKNNPELIPESWYKHEKIGFPGTLYHFFNHANDEEREKEYFFYVLRLSKSKKPELGWEVFNSWSESVGMALISGHIQQQFFL